MRSGQPSPYLKRQGLRAIIIHMKKGLFITFEGPDGSGKTTVSTAVCQRLESEGYQVRYTREPGGSRIAEEIRRIILNPENTDMDARTEALLYAASRRQHLVDKVLPALNEGITIISDRFIDSSLAYQGVGRGIGIQEVYDINQFAIEGHMPDKTIFLNIDAETGLARINANRSYLDRLDQESEDFHNRVHAGYMQVIEKYKDRMIIIDASRPVDQVIEDACKAVKGLLDA
jgi:dTMP kinase